MVMLNVKSSKAKLPLEACRGVNMFTGKVPLFKSGMDRFARGCYI